MFLFSNDLGVDLGTSNVLIYADGKGLVVREPSVVAMDKNTGKILQVGAAARNMLGRTPGNVVAMHPLKDGTVSDHEMTVRMLQEMFKTATKASFFTPKPRVVISVPSGVSEVEERSVINAAIEAGVERVVCLSTDKAAYPINAMGISKAMMEHVITANARVSAQRGGPVICCTRYGNVMCSRGSVIPLFVEQIKAGNPITITDPNMTRFLMNLDEAVDLVMFAFEHANPGDLFIQKSDASTIGDLAKAVQQLFGDTGTRVIGTRHGEKLYETLMTKEERMRSEDMGNYYRVAADNRDLNYDKYFIKGQVHTQADEDYTSHNTRRLDVEGTIKKIMTTEYIQEALKEAGKA